MAAPNFHRLASAYTNRDIAYFRLGQYQRAIQNNDQALILAPKDALTYADRGYSGYSDDRLGQCERTNQDWSRACEWEARRACEVLAKLPK